MAEIRSVGELEAWLQDKSSSVAQMIALRTAMRALPCLDPRLRTPHDVLAYFRTLYFFWCVLRFPDELQPVTAVETVSGIEFLTRNADGDFNRYRSEGEARLARDAALRMALRRATQSFVAIGDSHIGNGADAVSYAIDAGPDYVSEFWDGINKDIAVLGMNAHLGDELAVAAVVQSACLAYPASRLLAAWRHLKGDLLEPSPDWDVWLGWYDLRASGTPSVFGLQDPMDREVALSIARTGEGFWAADPFAVNHHIVAAIDAARISQESLLAQEHAIPEQQLAPLITEEKDGIVVRAKRPFNETQASPVAGPFRRAVLDSIEDIGFSFPVHNHKTLTVIIGRLHDAFGPSLSDMDIISVSIAAERLNQFARRAEDECGTALAGEVLALTITLHDGLVHFEEWRLFKAQSAQDPRVPDEVVEKAGAAIAKLANPDVVAAEVTAELTDELSAMITSDGVVGTDLQRSSYLRGVSNVLSTLAKMALKAFKNFGSDSYSGIRKGTETAGKVTAVFLLASATTELITLTGASTPWFGWLVAFLEFLKSKAG